MQAARAVSVERGRDSRKCTLIAFGGSGPVHAAGLAEQLGIERIVVPEHPGVFSALGLLSADLEFHGLRSIVRRSDDLEWSELDAAFGTIEAALRSRATARHVSGLSLQRFAESSICRPVLEPDGGRHGGPLGRRVPGLGLRPCAREGVRLPTRRRDRGRVASRHRACPEGCASSLASAREWPTRCPPIEKRLLRPDLRVVGYASHPENAESHVMGARPRSRRGLRRDDPGSTYLELLPRRIRQPPSRVRNRMSGLDPFTVEVVRHRLSAITDEMSLRVVRTAMSVGIKSLMDFSTAICDRCGRVVVQGLNLPLHLGAAPDAMEAFLRVFGDSIQPDDVYLLNDPYSGGMHLPDIFVARPLFDRNVHVGFAVAIAHHTDVGGRVPGSSAADSSEIYAEGLRLPPLRLDSAGVRNETLETIIRANVRLPRTLFADLQAQVTACRIAEERYRDLCAEYGGKQVERATKEIIDDAEARTRAAIATLPDGVYAAEDFVDDAGIDLSPVRLCVSITIDGDRILANFDGTDRQVDGAINATLSFTKSATYLAIKSITPPDIPCNQGFMKAVSVTAPPGTVVNLAPPAACAARGVTGYRTADLVFRALADAVPSACPPRAREATPASGWLVTRRRAFPSFLWTRSSGPGVADRGKMASRGLPPSPSTSRTPQWKFSRRSIPCASKHMDSFPTPAGPGSIAAVSPDARHQASRGIRRLVHSVGSPSFSSVRPPRRQGGFAVMERSQSDSRWR